jgi:hypothetical protein
MRAELIKTDVIPALREPKCKRPPFYESRGIARRGISPSVKPGIEFAKKPLGKASMLGGALIQDAREAKDVAGASVNHLIIAAFDQDFTLTAEPQKRGAAVNVRLN